MSKPIIDVVVGLITRGDNVLMALRPYGATRGGMWEYPGGKVEPNESDGEALERELREEIGCCVYVGDVLDRTTLDVECRYRLALYRCTIMDGSPEPLASLGLAWVDPHKAVVDRQIGRAHV